MNKITLIALICLTSSMVISADSVQRKTRPAGHSKPSGGIVERAVVGKTLQIVNNQKSFSTTDLQSITRDIRLDSMVAVFVDPKPLEASECPLRTVTEIAGRPDVGAVVLITENDNLPILTTSPDGCWAVLNLHTLVADQPSAEVLSVRVRKMLWGAVARALGAGGTGDKNTALAHFTNAKEIDALSYIGISPEAHNALIDLAKSHGMNLVKFASYRTACTEGWAPQPTNEYQKAIWDDVHAIPTEPIKIKPETHPAK